MKKILIFGLMFVLSLFLFSLHGYSQTRDKTGILGTVTIDEKGNVTVQSFGEKQNKTPKGLEQTGNSPIRFSDPSKVIRPATKTETSGLNTVLNDFSHARSIYPPSPETKVYFSTDSEIVRFEGSTIAGQSESAQILSISSKEPIMIESGVPGSYETSVKSRVNSQPPRLSSDGSESDVIAIMGKMADPNLAYQSGSGSLTVTGTSINLSITIVNNGTLSAGASQVGYYLSSDVSITTTPNYLIGTDAVPSLAVGAINVETHSVDVAYNSVPCGTYYVFFCIDYLKQVTESNENDNDWYFTSPTVTIPCAPNIDLASGTSSLSVDGTRITLSTTAINNGSTTAEASVLGYYLSPDASYTTTPNYLIGSDPVSSLAVGATSAESITVDVSASSIPCGTYYVFFVFDHLNQVTESNEVDNIWYFSSPQVTIPCVPNLDLSSGSSSLTVDGTSATVSLTVINNGSTTAGASTIGYYLSPDASYTTTPNYLIGTDAVPSLAIGATSAETITVNVLGLSVPCGTYYVFFVFDYQNQVTESNETDNIWYFSSPQVTIPCLPNLDLSSGTANLTVNGTSVTISVTAINNGEATAAASELGYYLSQDVNLTTTPNYPIGTDDVTSLAIGATSAETITVDVLERSVPCGTYYVIFKFDNQDQVTESNENDNVYYWSTPTVIIPCIPNLDLSPGSSSLTVNGTSITISVTAINNGSTTADASVLGYYLSPDASYTTVPNYLIGSNAVSSLPVNGISQETITVDVSSSSVPCGTYYIFFVFDHLNKVTESNENDNTWYFSSPQVTIPCLPNLDLLSASASLSVTGTNISLAVTAVNNGSSTAGASQLGYYLSPDPNITTVPNYLIGTDAVPSLAVGATSNQTFAQDVLTVSPSIPAGTYYVFFVFDHLKQITESDEIDNEWYFTSPLVTVPLKCTLGVTPVSFSVSSSAGSERFTVTTPCDWTASSNQLWCTVTPSGAGNGTLTATFTANPTCIARSATITVSVAGLTPFNVTVSQSACTLSATPASRSLAAGAGSTSFALSSSCGWIASSNQTWCTLSQVSGTGNATITANCTANTSGSDRIATITFSSSGCSSFDVTITQTGCTLSATPADRQVSASSGATSFTVSGICEWTAESNQTWCTVIPSSSTGPGTITANITANTTCKPRIATITLKAPGLDPVSVTVTQASCTLSASPANRSVTSDAGSTSFTLTTNCEWTASSNQTWCTISHLSGSGDVTLNASFTANTTREARIATIAISTAGCDPYNVTVNQDGCCPSTEHFVPAWTTSSPDYMNIYVHKALYGVNNLEPGDEIGLFDGNICVGAGKVVTTIDNSHQLYIRASRNSGSGNGYTPGNPVVYRYWDLSAAKEVTNVTASYSNANPEWSTTGTYLNASTSHIELTGSVTGINELEISRSDIVLYPNPTDGKLYIRSDIVILKGAKVKVINSSGVVLSNRIMDTNEVTFDFTGNARGVYYLIIEGKYWSFTEKVVYK